MTGFFEDLILRDEGLEQQDLNDLNAILPDLEKLDDAAIAEWPKIAVQIPIMVKVFPILLRIAKKVIAKQRTLS